MSAPALVFDAVTKRYRKDRPPALDQLTFTIPRGVVAGFVGPNGAGKTTAFSVVSGFLPPDGGHVDILGEGPFDPWALKGRLGVLPQDAELSDRHTPVEVLTHLGRLQGLSAAEAATEAALRVDEVRLGDRAGHRIGTLSHGMRRRVAVASALLGSPELVLLDEPTSGLDPAQAASLRAVLAELRGARTVVVSSHNLLELEQLCDWVVMVDHGRCVRQGSVADVTEQGQRLVVRIGPGELDTADLQEALPRCLVEVVDREVRVQAPPDVDLDAVSVSVMSALVRARIGVREVRRGTSLEQHFLDATRAPG